MSEQWPYSSTLYPEEDHLRSDSITVSASIGSSSAQHPELARTHGALNTAYYLHEGSAESWDNLTAGQPEDKRLTLGTYSELHQLSRLAIPNQEAYGALEYIDTIHDVCKDLKIMRALGLDPERATHDEGLRRLFLPGYEAVRHHYLPSYDEASRFTAYQQEIISGVLSAPFNFIRFVQSQASEHEIMSLSTMPRHILLAAIQHGIHDLGGAMGHKVETTSLTLDEPAAVRLLDAAHALLGRAADLGLDEGVPITPRTRQRAYQALRIQRLGLTATEPNYIGFADIMTKLTIADLLRCYSAEDFVVPQAAFDRLPSILRTVWATNHALPLQYPDGHDRFESLGTEYAPAFLRSLGPDEEGIYTALGYFAHVQSLCIAMPIIEASMNYGSFPTSSPYRIINFYHLAQAFASSAAYIKTASSITVELIANEDTITPLLHLGGDRRDSPHLYPLMHPDYYHSLGGLM